MKCEVDSIFYGEFSIIGQHILFTLIINSPSSILKFLMRMGSTDTPRAFPRTVCLCATAAGVQSGSDVEYCGRCWR